MEKIELIKNILGFCALISLILCALFTYLHLKQKRIKREQYELERQQTYLNWEKENAEWNKKINEQLTKELDKKFKIIEEQQKEIKRLFTKKASN